MPENDLHDFLISATRDIANEYLRVSRRVSEDPGTAGDQGEENWATILRSWLPRNYHVVCKGRILGADGTAGPQMDVLILSPSYPECLLDKKLYLAGGIVAAFECKLTLRSTHLKKFFESCVKIRSLAPPLFGTPYHELFAAPLVGLLAHTHEWKKENSNPTRTVRTNLVNVDSEVITKPFETPDLVCIADLGVWTGTRMLYQHVSRAPFLHPAFPNPDNLAVVTAYSEHAVEATGQVAHFTPIGSMLTYLYQRMAWIDPHLRSLGRHMLNARVRGTGQGTPRDWNPADLSKGFFRGLKTNGLATSGEYNEWHVAF